MHKKKASSSRRKVSVFVLMYLLDKYRTCFTSTEVRILDQKNISSSRRRKSRKVYIYIYMYFILSPLQTPKKKIERNAAATTSSSDS